MQRTLGCYVNRFRCHVAAFDLVQDRAGLLATIVVEMIVEGRAWGWHYAPLMPREPLTGVGLVPIAMWIVVPLFTLWLSRNIPPRKSLNR